MTSPLKVATLATETTAEGITRKIRMVAAYDEEEPRRCHGAELWFSVQRGKVGVNMNWMAPFYLTRTRKTMEASSIGRQRYEFDGLGHVSYHSPVPLREDQAPAHTECEFTGGVCYADGSGLAAGSIFNKAVEDPDKIWEELESWLTDTEKRIAEEQAEKARAG